MLFSMWHIENDNMDEEPGFRLCNSFEHLRHEVGKREVTEVFDDGDLNKQDAAKTKMFFDPSQKSAKTKERWGAAEFLSLIHI